MQTTQRTACFTLLLEVFLGVFLAGCSAARLPRAEAASAEPEINVSAVAHGAPQAPFDTTPITPAESAGAAQAD